MTDLMIIEDESQLAPILNRQMILAKIAETRTVDEALDMLSTVTSMQVYLKAEKHDAEIQNQVAEMKVRTQRKIGQLIKQGQESGEIAGPGDYDRKQMYQADTFAPKTYEEIGIERMQAHRFKAIAEIPEDVFDSEIKETIEAKKEVTTAGLLKVGKEIKKADERAERLDRHQRFSDDINAVETTAQPKETAIYGQWYTLGKHRLYCGSNTDDAFLSELPKAAMAFADPPYNANAAEWDSNYTWSCDYLTEFADLVVVTPGISAISDFFKITEMPYKWSISAYITNGMTRGALGFGNWIYAAIFSKKESIYQNTQDVLRVNISPLENDGHYHKGKKPTGFMVQTLDLFTKEGDTVIDPFAGSGTTIFCCEKMGRKCIAAEISPDFVNLIIENYEQNAI